MLSRRQFTSVVPCTQPAHLPWLRRPKCIALSFPLDRIRVSLERTWLARLFEQVFAAADVASSKPAPDIFVHAVERMGIAPAECLVIEDSPVGVSAAAAAGMTAIGSDGGTHAGRQVGGQLVKPGEQTVAVVALRGC
ncbi:MAG: HAD family hydrolase [Alphaproteobacteria bacterium]|nr:MAG: HAD family hydrolase [Alphaproteobacteria bacterium]